MNDQKIVKSKKEAIDLCGIAEDSGHRASYHKNVDGTYTVTYYY